MSDGLLTFDESQKLNKRQWQELCDVIDVPVFDPYENTNTITSVIFDENEEFRQIAKQNFSESITFDTIEFNPIPIMTEYTIDQCMEYWVRIGDDIFYKVCHGGFKRPQDVIQDYYYQKRLESVAPQKPTKFLMLARGSHKRSLEYLYLKEHWLELCFAELARKNS